MADWICSRCSTAYLAWSYLAARLGTALTASPTLPPTVSASLSATLAAAAAPYALMNISASEPRRRRPTSSLRQIVGRAVAGIADPLVVVRAAGPGGAVLRSGMFPHCPHRIPQDDGMSGPPSLMCTPRG